MYSFLRLTLALLVAVLVIGPATSASPATDPVPWSIRTPFNETAILDGLTGGISFPNEEFTTNVGDVVVDLTKVYSWSVASEASPDQVSDLPFRFGVELRDDASAETALLSFEGMLSGQFWRTGGALTAEFSGDGVRTVELGGREYELRLTEFLAPTGYGLDGAGAIRASMRITLDDGGTLPNLPDGGLEPEEPTGGEGTLDTPEPATLAMVLSGLSVAGWRALRRGHWLGRGDAPAKELPVPARVSA